MFCERADGILNENYGGRYVAVAWPTRSPDFNSLKCIIWNCVMRQCNLVVHYVELRDETV